MLYAINFRTKYLLAHLSFQTLVCCPECCGKERDIVIWVYVLDLTD